MSGFGVVPYGTSPFGLPNASVATLSGGVLLTDPSTGNSTGSRAIDPATGDYVVDSNGRVSGMDDIRQLVLLRVKTTAGSSTVTTLGNSLRSIDRITSNISNRVDSLLREAVKDLVDAGLIVVTDTTVEVVRPGVVYARLRWQVVVTGIDDEAALPIAS